MKNFSVRFCTFILSITLLAGAIPMAMADSSLPSVSAKSAVLAEGSTGKIIWSKNGDERLPMASTTKIMTALVAIENSDDLTRPVKISPDACGIEGSSVYLKEGEKLTLEQLLYALLLESANDSACAIAIEIAGSLEKFADMMNGTAERIGMVDSHFTNPHGLDDEEHYTTAADMARLAVHALNNEDFARIVSTYKTTIPMNGDEGTRLLLNHNKMLKYYDGAIGVKTGFTKRSGRCLVSAAERDGVRMIAVTLSAPDDWNDHKSMLDFGFSRYKHITLVEAGSVNHSIPVTGSTSDCISISNRDAIEVTLPTDAPDVKCTVEAPRFAIAPVNEGDILGYAVFRTGNEELAKVPLYAVTGCDAKENPSLWRRILDLYK
ncbi:MAG: D-alanyl-D-alanine carboxypeptidase [Clostridia bacterium]|nr:D-alanyl-D-alanine carboxypeptidase [Clostridia bacterium]